MLKEDLKNILAENKRLECPADQVYRYMLWVYSLLVKQSGSWVLDTGLVGTKCHTEQHNTRATMA